MSLCKKQKSQLESIPVRQILTCKLACLESSLHVLSFPHDPCPLQLQCLHSLLELLPAQGICFLLRMQEGLQAFLTSFDNDFAYG